MILQRKRFDQMSTKLQVVKNNSSKATRFQARRENQVKTLTGAIMSFRNECVS